MASPLNFRVHTSVLGLYENVFPDLIGPTSLGAAVAAGLRATLRAGGRRISGRDRLPNGCTESPTSMLTGWKEQNVKNKGLSFGKTGSDRSLEGTP